MQTIFPEMAHERHRLDGLKATTVGELLEVTGLPLMEALLVKIDWYDWHFQRAPVESYSNWWESWLYFREHMRDILTE
jgi:hypothetical protein